MSVKVQVFVIVFLILGLVGIIYMVRKRSLELKYVLAWLACDVALIVLTVFPDLMSRLAVFMGIQSPVNMLFFFGFLFSLLIIFSLTVALSRATANHRRMAQKMAIMENELRKNRATEEKVTGMPAETECLPNGVKTETKTCPFDEISTY